MALSCSHVRFGIDPSTSPRPGTCRHRRLHGRSGLRLPPRGLRLPHERLDDPPRRRARLRALAPGNAVRDRDRGFHRRGVRRTDVSVLPSAGPAFPPRRRGRPSSRRRRCRASPRTRERLDRVGLGRVVLGGIAALAMGSQASAVHRATGLDVNTTFISGMLARVGEELAGAARASNRGWEAALPYLGV